MKNINCKYVFIFFTNIFSNLLFGEVVKKDSLETTKYNYIYLVPTSIAGDLFWDLDNYWIEVGYEREIKRNNYISVKLGGIFFSQPTSVSLLTKINSKKTVGYNFNLEYKKVFYKKLYYSVNLIYQMTNTQRNGIFDAKSYSFISDENYNVYRAVYCLLPKLGFHLVNKKQIYTDVGIGFGIRLIDSYSDNKSNTDVDSGNETMANKEFDKGAKFAQKISFQIKLGYNF
jgi:hypothetical protein